MKLEPYEIRQPFGNDAEATSFTKHTISVEMWTKVISHR